MVIFHSYVSLPEGIMIYPTKNIYLTSPSRRPQSKETFFNPKLSHFWRKGLLAKLPNHSSVTIPSESTAESTYRGKPNAMFTIPKMVGFSGGCPQKKNLKLANQHPMIPAVKGGAPGFKLICIDMI
jgi:hypothetical protein